MYGYILMFICLAGYISVKQDVPLGCVTDQSNNFINKRDG